MVAKSEEARNENLDKLQDAVKEYTKAEIARIEAENKFIRTAMRGRGSTDKVALKNLSESEKLVQEELNDFLLIDLSSTSSGSGG